MTSTLLRSTSSQVHLNCHLSFGIADRNLEDHAGGTALDRLVDVGGHGADEGVDLRFQPEAGDLLDRLEVLVGDGRHARFDAVDADFRELLGDRDFVGDAEHHARRLFAVPKRRVMDLNTWRQAEGVADLRHEIERTDPPFVWNVELGAQESLRLIRANEGFYMMRGTGFPSRHPQIFPSCSCSRSR